MLQKTITGISTLAIALVLTQCTNEDTLPSSPDRKDGMVGMPSFKVAAAAAAIGTPFAWAFSNEQAQGSEKVSMVKTLTRPELRNSLFIVRRAGTRLQAMFYYEDEEFLDLPSAPYGPTNVGGTPSVVVATSGPDSNQYFTAYKTTGGKLSIWKGQFTGSVIATLTPPTTDFGNPSLVYNTVTRRLELAHREGGRIRHWNGTRGAGGVYSWQSALVPGTGGTGTRVISSVSLTQNTDGKLVVGSRIFDRSFEGVKFGRLRSWGTAGSGWPFTWTTSNIFGSEDASTEAPSLAPTGEGSVLAVANIRAIANLPELAQFEIRNNVATQLSIFAAHYSQPSLVRMATNSLYLMALNTDVATPRLDLAHGTR